MLQALQLKIGDQGGERRVYLKPSECGHGSVQTDFVELDEKKKGEVGWGVL